MKIQLLVQDATLVSFVLSEATGLETLEQELRARGLAAQFTAADINYPGRVVVTYKEETLRAAELWLETPINGFHYDAQKVSSHLDATIVALG